MKTTIWTKQRIINTLLLNASFIENLGLMHGKMGIAIFFFHLARETNNAIYEDYAGELIDEIYEEISVNTPLDFENGLAGIGWGIEYLVQNRFIEADTNEVLEEFDTRILKKIIYNTPTELGLLDGLMGIGAYLLIRIQNPQANDDSIQTLTNKQNLIHLIDELDRRTQDVSQIITEPQTISNDIKQPQTISNIQTTETTDTKGTIETTLSNPQTTETIGTTNPPPPHFDLFWDYPILLWFIGELHKQNIFNYKVKKIINRLIEPLADDQNLPKKYSNRLLLALALTKLHQTIGKIETTETNLRSNAQTSSNKLKQLSNPQTKEAIEIPEIAEAKETISNNIKHLQIISNKLISSINYQTLHSEFPTSNISLRYGSSGIIWIYKQFLELVLNDRFKIELEYWTEECENNISEIIYNQSSLEDTNNNESAFGILTGYAGTLLITF